MVTFSLLLGRRFLSSLSPPLDPHPSHFIEGTLCISTAVRRPSRVHVSRQRDGLHTLLI